MNDPRTILDRQAADIAVDATITNSANPLLGRPSLIGRGGLGLLISCKIRRTISVELLDEAGPEGVSAFGFCVILGTIRPSKRETHAATKETTVACTCSKDKFPNIIRCRVSGSSSSPTLAAVPNRAERFISRFPLRLRMTGIIIMSSSIARMAFQRWAPSLVGVWIRESRTYRDMVKQFTCE